MVDYEVLRGWSHVCRMFHDRHESCDSEKTYSPKSFTAIDCRTLTVVPAPNCSHAALSYVWGQPKPTEAYGGNQQTINSQTNPASQLDFNRLPPVIQYTITVTSNLGFFFLWVDKYCIDQGDNKDKHD